MNNNSIILLRGFSHSGKDFVGKILCEQYGYTRFAFADSLKKIVSNEFHCDIHLLHSQEGKNQICENDHKKRTYRQILIDEALTLRNKDPDIFSKHCCEEIKASGCTKIVITDWRYSNEELLIQNKFPDFTIIPVHIQLEDQIDSPVNDISEYQLLGRIGDYTIKNYLNDAIYEEVDRLIGNIC